jgi:hypothetical protein
MKSWIKKYAALILSLVIISGVCFLFGSRKEGMFIDEIYTYGLANSYYAPYVTDLKDGDLIDKVITRDELYDYLSVDDDDRFAAGSVYYNQTQDVHPPLYYWLLNFFSSLCPGEFSMWIGLGLNYFIYIAALLLLYKLVMLLFDSRLNAVAAVLLYGLSTIGLSTMLMIRMYVLLMFFTVLLGYLIAELMHKKRTLLYPLIGLTIFLGLMTQYYFVFYAFFVCLAYDIYALIKKDYRGFVMFSLAALCGAVCLIPAFPACLDQLFADKLVSGGNAVENLTTVSQYSERIGTFVSDSRHRMKAIVYTAIVLVLAGLICCKKISAAVREKRVRFDSLVLIIPAFVCFFLIAVIAPVTEIRYIYNLVPMLVLAVSFLLHLVEQGDIEHSGKRGVQDALAIIILVLCLWEARCIAPDYLYDEYSDYDEMLQAHSSSPCVYIDNNYFSPITYDMLQLMNFDEFFVTNDTSSDAMLDYIGDAKEMVVFIDISKQWSSGYDAKEVVAELEESTGFTKSQSLYSNGFSAVYLLKN